MAETHNDIDNKTRANLAYIWTFIAGFILCYIVFRWGDKMEILTLIIGLIGGTILGGIFGIYFGGSISKKPDGNPTVNTGDNTTVNTVSEKPAIDGGNEQRKS